MKILNTDTCNETEDSSNLDRQEHFSNDQLDASISTEEIQKHALKLLNGKACGLDSIMNEHIKSTLHIMMPIYHKLFNIIFDTGLIPSIWTEGCIIPIYKRKGNDKSPENYRPITLLSCLGKFFTSIINAMLQKLNLIDENQTGFKKNILQLIIYLLCVFYLTFSLKKRGKCIVLSSILKRLLILFGGRVFAKKSWSLKLQENVLTLYLTCIKKLNHAYLSPFSNVLVTFFECKKSPFSNVLSELDRGKFISVSLCYLPE